MIKFISYLIFPHLINDENDEKKEVTKKNHIINKYDNEVINQIIRINNKKVNKINKIKKLISLETEIRLIFFLENKIRMVMKNIDDFEYEKQLTYEITDPYLYIIDHSFTDKECDNILKQFEKETQNHYNGVTGGGYTPNVKRTTEINITRTQNWEKWNELCFKRLNIALQKYATYCKESCHNEFLYNIIYNQYGIINDTGYQLQKYKKEQQYYKWHQDGGLKEGCHQHRIITYLWYLNDVTEGGETYFFHGKVKPKKGRLVLFPACWNYNHKGETPISNDKYIITGWVYSNS